MGSNIGLGLRSTGIETAGMPPTRKLARAASAKYYFTGKTCRREHLAPRYTSTGQCVDCQSENYHQNAPPRQRATLDQMRERRRKIIKDRGGRLVSGKLTSAKSDFRVICSEGHTFETNYDRLSQGKWCRKCGDISAGRRLLGYTVDDLQKVATERGGELLSLSFNGVKKKHKWSCQEHGTFWATPDAIINSNSWCPNCWHDRRGEAKRLPIEKVLDVIKKRGGHLVSPPDEYEALKSRVRIRCADGHEWEATAASLVGANSWCPECSGSAGELITRRIFEATYGVRFPNCRPDFLKTEEGGRLELDGYNADLALAFEYQGPHHHLPAQMARDLEKRKRCEALGIRLLEVPFVKNPYYPGGVLDVVAQVIGDAYPNQKVVLPDEDIFPSKLQPLIDLAQSRGGKLISNVYLGGRKKLVWKCSNPEHPPWKATAEQTLKKNSWCPHCAGNARKDIKWLRKFGADHKLKLLAKSYDGSHKKYHWECEHGHEFVDAKPNILQRVGNEKPACRICAGTRRVIAMTDLQEMAAERGGECLSLGYENAHAPLEWRCASGHTFSRIWNQVQQGYWCRSKGCPDNRRWGVVDRIGQQNK